MLLEILLIAFLTVINGVLAMSELAVVSSRPVRLKSMAEKKVPGAETALRLSEDSGRFLSTVQIGITLVGILNGALSGATVGRRLADWLVGFGIDPGTASTLGVGIVVVLITYFSLIIGELVPKQLALRHSESIAVAVAPAMNLLSMLTIPIVWLLDKSGTLVLIALGQGGERKEGITEDEVRGLIAEAEHEGVLKSDERSMITGVMRFADRSAQALMTPRRDVEVLDLEDGPEVLIEQLRTTRRSRLPVQNGQADEIMGVVLVRDILRAMDGDALPDIKAHVLEAPVVLDQVDALSVLRAIRASIVHLALVYDEYGHFEGIVTAGDVLEAIAGEFREEGGEAPSFTERSDGSYLVEGWMPVDEFAERIGVELPEHPEYLTVAGMYLSQSRHLPKEGETVRFKSLELEVVDLDGRRIDKLLVRRVEAEPTTDDAGAPSAGAKD